MEITRRELMSGAAATLTASSMGFFQDRPTLKIGLIGCGGRGSGAIRDSLSADPGVVLHAIGDVFPDRLNSCLDGLKKDMPNRVKVDSRSFTGLDAYQKVIASGVDVVILATPPGFRPTHFAAAVEAGKHVFMEKPAAVDGPGIRAVIAAAKKASEKNLTVVAGTQRRADLAYMDCIERIHNGEMGEIVHMSCYWNQGGLWTAAQTPGMSDSEWHIRNWLYFAAMSGDHIVEQHVHNLDVCNWVMKSHPVKCVSMGGRSSRVEPIYGHIFDHFATEYEYANGVKMMSYCRQSDGCASNVSERIVGSKGTSNANTSIRGEKNWRYDGARPNPYVQEHVRLYDSIKKNLGYNEGVQVAESTLTAIMGRMSAYSGEEVTWEKALNSNVSLVPKDFQLGMSIPVPPVAIPGKTKGVF
jgi:predicted dehydrogenase